MKQCFRYYKYGHIGNQCCVRQICGYCSAAHESKENPSRDSTRKCPACKGLHTAWSDTCPARKRGKARVAEAKACKPSSWKEFNLAPPSTTPNYSLPLPVLPSSGSASAGPQVSCYFSRQKNMKTPPQSKKPNHQQQRLYITLHPNQHLKRHSQMLYNAWLMTSYR